MSSLGPSCESLAALIADVSSAEDPRIGVLICGATGVGKTSLIRMLNGYEPTSCDFASDTNQTQLYHIKGTPYYACDTPGFLDNRYDENQRSTLFKGMLQTITSQKFKVKKIMILMSGAERLNDALVPWLSDVMAATCVDMNQVYLILTKLDTSFAIKNAQTLIQKAQQIFNASNIITCGYNGQGINNSQVMEKFSNLESLPDTNIVPNFETSHHLHSMLSSVQNDIHTTERNHKIYVAQEILSKEREINDVQNQLREKIRIWEKRWIWGGIPDVVASPERLAIEQLRNDQTRISQSQADVAHLRQRMRAIQDELESRSAFVSLFKRLITA